MAGSSLFTLIDDIASVLDDVAMLTKVAAKKTAGVLGDDLALNAQQVAGVRADRELPVVWAVAKGSAINKLILVPLALGISALIPWAVTPLLMIGGAYLCFEGCEKLAHPLLHRDADEDDRAVLRAALTDPNLDLVALEKSKIKGAVRTDFILSAEIVIIALGTVADATLVTRLSVLAGIATLMTVGVYGLVAGIVKLDDLGLLLTERAARSRGASAALQRAFGQGLLRSAPYLMKTLSIAGTAAMFLVGGGILTHGVPAVHHWIEGVERAAHALPAGSLLAALAPTAINMVVGLLAGALILLVVTGVTAAVKGLRARRS